MQYRFSHSVKYGLCKQYNPFPKGGVQIEGLDLLHFICHDAKLSGLFLCFNFTPNLPNSLASFVNGQILMKALEH